MTVESVTYQLQGYQSSVDRSNVRRDRCGSGSLDMQVDPLSQKMQTRSGTSNLNSTSTSGAAESKFGGRARQIVEFSSDSLTDDYPTYLVVLTDEAGADGYGYFVGNSGTLNGLGRFFDTTNHYPAIDGGDDGLTARTLSAYEHRWHPHWSENTALPQGRGCSIAQRTTLLAGARRVIGSGRWLLLNGVQSNPKMWNREFNDSTASGTNVDRLRLWGRVPPLHLPRFLTSNLPTAVTTSSLPWKEGDSFFMCMTFVYSDGSESKPFVPQAIVDTAAAGTMIAGANRTDEYANIYGKVLVPSTTGSDDYFSYLRGTQIPIGDTDDCIGRKFYRTVKTTGSAVPTLGAMRFWDYIPDNTTTTWDFRNGDDDSLVLLDPDDEVAATGKLFSTTFPKRARYTWAFDGRIGIGYLKDNPAAILICPTGPGNGSAMSNSRTNNGSDAKLITNGHFLVRVYNNAGTKTLQLRYLAAATATPAAFNTTEITLTAAKTLQDVVNEINATLPTTASGGGEWAAQVCPGTPATATADNIDYTTADNSSGVAYDFGDDSATIINDGTVGNQRSWNNAWIGVLYFTQAYMSAQPVGRDEFCHTESGPSLKNQGSYGSAFTFSLSGPGWRIRPPEDAGIFMGAAPLADGCVIFYSKSVWRYLNQRGGTTGEDFDYRLTKISNKGCVSWSSITHGNNWAGWLSREGYCVTDGNKDNERIITREIWDAEQNVGDLAYEINQCVLATAADSDGAYLSAEVIGDSLFLSYRKDSNATYPNRTFRYGFAASAANSGLAQILDAQGQPFGWSPPWTIGYGALGSVRNASGLVKLGAKDEADSAHSTATGRVDRFDTGTNDVGSAPIVGLLYQRMETFGGFRARCQKFRAKHKTPTGSTTAMTINRTVDRAGSTGYTLPVSGSDPFVETRRRTKIAGQVPSRCAEVVVTNDGLGGSAFEWYGCELEIRRLDSRPELD